MAFSRASAAAVAALSGILVVFSGSGLLLETAYRSNSQAEAALCRLHICASDRLIESVAAARLDPAPEAAARAVAAALEALRRDAAFANRWSDAAEALATAGQRARAAAAFRRAVALAPNSPPVLMQAANFFFRSGEAAAALPLTAHILRLVRNYDALIFYTYSRCGAPLEEVLRAGMPEKAEAGRGLLASMLAAAPAAELATVWTWLRARRYDDTKTASRYVDALLTRRLYSEAAALQASYSGAAADGNLIYNGSFEAAFQGSRLDWTASREVRDSSVSRGGNWSMRLSFDGAENVDYHGVSQIAVVPAGPVPFPRVGKKQRTKHGPWGVLPHLRCGSARQTGQSHS